MRTLRESATTQQVTKSGFSHTQILQVQSNSPTHKMHFKNRIHRIFSKFSFCASLTVEASVVLPIFTMAVLELIGILGMYETYDRTVTGTFESTKTLACVADLADALDADVPDTVHLEVPVTLKPAVSLTGLSRTAVIRSLAKTWNGYEIGTTQQKYVYITDNREAYHTTPHCSYLEVTVREISKAEATGQACRLCVKEGYETGHYYVTEDGDCYHVDIGCSSLRRTIYMVSQEEVLDLHPCVRCGDKTTQQGGTQ